MYKYLKKIFAKKQTSIEHRVCSIKFDLNTDGTVNITCDWPAFNSQNMFAIETIAADYATMLYMINQGLFHTDITATLDDGVDDNDKYDKLFIDNVFLKWLARIEERETHSNNHPIIKPSEVFKKL